jgi:hypothetical protein
MRRVRGKDQRSRGKIRGDIKLTTCKKVFPEPSLPAERTELPWVMTKSEQSAMREVKTAKTDERKGLMAPRKGERRRESPNHNLK